MNEERNKKYNDLPYKEEVILNSYKYELMKNNNLQNRIDKAFELLQRLHYKFEVEDSIHYDIEEIQEKLKGDDE